MMRAKSNLLPVSVFVGAFLYLYLILFVPPRTPALLGFDDKLFLYEATRILQGQVMYRDFFELNFPVIDLFYVLLIRLFGPRVWIPNLCLLCLGMGFLAASIVISRRLVRGTSVFLPGLLFLCLGFRNYLDASHHWYSSLLIMSATVILVISREPAYLLVAGALTGLAACFSLNHGVVAAVGFAVFLWWCKARDTGTTHAVFRSEAYFLVSFVLIFGGCFAYFAFKVGLYNFAYSTIWFPIRYWSIVRANSWYDYVVFRDAKALLNYQFRPTLRGLIIGLLVPWVYLAALGDYLFGGDLRPHHPREGILLIVIVGLSSFLAISNSASFWRLSTVSMPAFIVLVWLADRKGWRRKATVLLWTVVVLMMLRDISAARTNWTTYVDLPSGRVAPFDAELRWLAENTHPGEYVFDTNWWVYFLLEVKNPTKLMLITTGDFTRPEQVQSVLRDLEEHQVPLIIWSNDLDGRERSLPGDHIQPVRDYLHAHYRPIKNFQEATVWERLAKVHGRLGTGFVRVGSSHKFIATDIDGFSELQTMEIDICGVPHFKQRYLFRNGGRSEAHWPSQPGLG